MPGSKCGVACHIESSLGVGRAEVEVPPVERDPEHQVRNRVEQRAVPVLGGAKLTGAAILLEAHPHDADDLVEEIGLVGERDVVVERGDGAIPVVDTGRDTGRRVRRNVERLAADVDVAGLVVDPVCEAESGVADRLSQRELGLAQGKLVGGVDDHS